MKKKDLDKLINLLKSGDFTIMYTDQGRCDVYSGKPNDGECVDEWIVIDEEEAEYREPDFEIEGSENGYEPFIVSCLVKALGGISDSY